MKEYILILPIWRIIKKKVKHPDPIINILKIISLLLFNIAVFYFRYDYDNNHYKFETELIDLYKKIGGLLTILKNCFFTENKNNKTFVDIVSLSHGCLDSINYEIINYNGKMEQKKNM